MAGKSFATASLTVWSLCCWHRCYLFVMAFHLLSVTGCPRRTAPPAFSRRWKAYAAVASRRGVAAVAFGHLALQGDARSGRHAKWLEFQGWGVGGG